MEAMNGTQQNATTNNTEQRTAQWTRDIEALCQELGITQSYENPINPWRPGTLQYLQIQHMILKQLRELVEEAAAIEYAGLTLAEIPAKELTALVQRVDKMQRAKDRECEAYAAESRAQAQAAEQEAEVRRQQILAQAQAPARGRRIRARDCRGRGGALKK